MVDGIGHDSADMLLIVAPPLTGTEIERKMRLLP
jgi:hypothetical protein